MERFENIDKFKSNSKYNESMTPRNSETSYVIGMVSELKSVFTILHSRFESIEKYLNSINDEIRLEKTKVNQVKSEAEPPVKPQVEPPVEPQVEPPFKPQVDPPVKPQVEPHFKPRAEPHFKPQAEPQVTPQVVPKVIIVPDPVRQVSSNDDESMELEISETNEYSEIKRGNVLAYFIDDSKQAIKEMMKGSSDSMQIRFPKLAFFKIKLIRLYAKSIKLITKPKKTSKNCPDELLCLNHEFYVDHTCSNQELIEDIIEEIKGSSKTNKWYNGLFEGNEARTENFKLFVEILFEKDIKKLIKKFCFKCCTDTQHVDLCRKKWRLLRDWIFSIITGFNY